MENWFNDISYWHWFIGALLFFILEILLPATVMLWMGIAAVVVGFILVVIPNITWEIQLLIFSVLSVASIFISRIYLNKHPIKTDNPTLNRRDEQYVGRRFTLEAPIVDGIGKIRIGDTFWRIEGDDMAAGTRVIVTGTTGVSLVVVATPEQHPE